MIEDPHDESKSVRPDRRPPIGRVGLACIAMTIAGGAALLWFVSSNAAEPWMGSLVDRGHFFFNLFEAIFWFAIGCALGLASILAPRRFRANLRVARVASAFFLLFGVTDVIEIRTGSFYEPLSLFALNAFCVVGLVICGVLVSRNRDSQRTR